MGRNAQGRKLISLLRTYLDTLLAWWTPGFMLCDWLSWSSQRGIMVIYSRICRPWQVTGSMPTVLNSEIPGFLDLLQHYQFFSDILLWLLLLWLSILAENNLGSREFQGLYSPSPSLRKGSQAGTETETWDVEREGEEAFAKVNYFLGISRGWSVFPSKIHTRTSYPQ